MKANHIERDFLKSIREAAPSDCEKIINILDEAENRGGFIDDNGEYTALGLLAGAIKEEIRINGILKMEYQD